MVAAVVSLGMVEAGGGRQAIDRAGFSAAVFTGVGRLLCPFVEFVFPSDGAVGVACAQPGPRQLADARKRLDTVRAITFSVVHISCLFVFLFTCPDGHTALRRILGKRVRKGHCERQKTSADKNQPVNNGFNC